MKRVIKCRGKQISDGEWVYGNSSTPIIFSAPINKDVAWIFQCIEEMCLKGNLGGWIAVEAKTVSYFIGLLDKNGKEIYEGDIVKRWVISKCCQKIDIIGIFEVIFNEQGFYCTNENYKLLGFANIDNETIEVIGNVPDNPELLK